MVAIALPESCYAQTAAGEEDSETIELPFKDEPLAVFISNRTLWIVAGTTARISSDILRNPSSRFVTSVKKINSQQANIFILSLNSRLYASVGKSGNGDTTQIVLRKSTAKPATLLSPALKGDVGQYTLDIPTKSAKVIVNATDPETGSEFAVTMLTDTGSGIYPARTFPQFSLLQTAQGIALQKFSDDYRIALNKSDFEVTSPSGLKISNGMAEKMETINVKAENEGGNITLFPYNSFKISDEKNFVPTTVKLFQEISQNNVTNANNSRLRLLQLYLAEGLFTESLGVANDILRSSYKFYRANHVAALRGASYFFMQRYNDALRDFSSPELSGDPEITMWLTLTNQMLGKENPGFNFSLMFDNYINKYPPVFIQKLAINAADGSIAQKQYETASSIFKILKKNGLDEPVNKYIDFMNAKILSETRSEDEAAKIWEKQTAEIDDPLIRASAEFSLINLLIKEDKIAPEKAIKRLEKVRIVWRGDNLEMNILILLGNLYVEDRQYDKALKTFKEIVLYFPNIPQTLTIAARMEDIFVKLYNKGFADSMPPLEALALFYEFRDLVPSGKDGDMMIRNLAERLVSIDLLDRAALLLNHQVQKRLQGNERSRVGAKLASIYLKNHQPKEALDTLKTTGYGDLAPDIQLVRQRLTAQALAEQGRSDKSIEVLNSDSSPDGTLLRLAIYWENKDWTNVIATAEEILGNRTDPGAGLNNEESSVLLKLATAYVYEHDAGQIQYLRDYFTPLLKNNLNKESFLFITSESGALDYGNLANLDADINSVKSFLESSRNEAKKSDKK